MPTETVAKIPAVCITVTRATGPTALCGKSRLFAGLDCWGHVAAHLGGRSFLADHEFGTDAKHDFAIVFADGHRYDGTISCRADDVNCDVRAHVLAHLNFAAGERPAHLSAEDFALYQSHISPAKRSAAQALLATYDI